MSQGDEKILRIRNLNEARRSMISRRYRDRAAEQSVLIDGDSPHSAVKSSRNTDDETPSLNSRAN
jgi:metallophosphoesterase superfamily enzyme